MMSTRLAVSSPLASVLMDVGRKRDMASVARCEDAGGLCCVEEPEQRKSRIAVRTSPCCAVIRCSHSDSKLP